MLDGYPYPVGILGDVNSYRIEEDDVFIGAIGDPRDKVKYYSPIVERGGRFINLIHPRANIGTNVRLGTGIVMGPFASITCDARVGNHVSIGALSNVAHDTEVGDWCQISSHCGLNGNAALGEGAHWAATSASSRGSKWELGPLPAPAASFSGTLRRASRCLAIPRFPWDEWKEWGEDEYPPRGTC